jgi:hypothetical protein
VSAQIVAHSNSRRADLAKLHSHNGAGYHPPWQEHYNKGKRACEVISEDADNFARKVAAPRVYKASVPPESVAEVFEVVNVLTVKVENENGLLAPRVYAEDSVSDIKRDNGDKESEDINTLAVEEIFQAEFIQSSNFMFFQSKPILSINR